MSPAASDGTDREGGAPSRAATRPRRRVRPPEERFLGTIVERLLVFQILCQVGLLFSFLGGFRVVFRSATFGSSLLLLVWLPRGRTRRHPAALGAMWVIAFVTLSFAHPGTATALAGAGQIAMYLAILGPLFWVSRCRVDLRVLRRVLLILWAWHTLSALFGVLQVTFPGQFQPSVTTWLASNPEKLNRLSITLTSGDRIVRPMGLTDLPGGAGTAGFYAVLIGLGFLMTERRRLMRTLAMVSLSVGLFCLYVSQVRSLLILAALCVLAFAALLAYRGKLGRLTAMVLVLSAIILGSFAWAVSLGGDAVTGRLYSLVADNPATVYYKNRGVFLEHTIDVLLPQYPFGAGLGRWGMMSAYFGQTAHPDRQPIWAEIQLTAWLLDGGVQLILAYAATLFSAFWVAWRLTTRSDPRSPLWLYAALILAYNVGALALSFNFPVFLSQMGLELWLLNATLYAAHLSEQRRARAGPAP